MRLGIDVAQQRLEFGEIVGRVRFGEELGFDGAWGFDHFRPMYGRGPGNCFEGMTTLAALAGRTNRIRLGLLVAGVTYRHPSILAAEAVTIDHASNGRLELGVGAAWYKAEHRQLGLDFPPVGERFDRLEDQLEIFVRLFTGDVVSYQGHQVSLDEAQLLPMPVQRPGPPIWIGGSGPKRTLPLVARFGDMWHTDSLADYGQLSARVDDLATAAGRDPAAIGRAASLSLSEPWDEVRRNAEARRSLGIDYLVCSWPSEGRRRVEEFWTKVAPDLAD
jgi:alkanesulfonate monooxygenase SsuD/methylene tetrahydromethanopterin reductase-like flavin-dependent oxidoreductase (luciferase family)